MKKQYIKYMKPEEIIERLSGGEIIKDDNSDKYFKMINGIICHLGKYYCVMNTKIRTDKQYYFENEELFKITEIGYYKARNGKKVFVYDIDGDNIRFVAIGGKRYYTGHTNGSFWNNNTQKPYDIIGKWED